MKSSNGVSSPSLFEGGKQEFQCEIGLFRKLPGTELFASIVTPEVELNLGEEVQLRSIVRSGDGKLCDHRPFFIMVLHASTDHGSLTTFASQTF